MLHKENHFVKIWNIDQSQSYQIVMIQIWKSLKKKKRERKENRYLNTWVWMLKFTIPSFHIFNDEYDKMKFSRKWDRRENRILDFNFHTIVNFNAESWRCSMHFSSRSNIEIPS